MQQHKLRILTMLAFVALVASDPALVSAQIDRARAEPYSDFNRYFSETVKYAEQKDRDSALRAAADLRKALGAMFGFSQDAPRYLNDGNLRDLGSQAQAFVDAMKDFSGRLQGLEEKLKKPSEDYGSELSNLKSSNDSLKDKFNLIWTNLMKTGQAVKAACMACIR